MPLFKKNILGQTIFIKKFVIRFFGAIIYGRFNWRYKTTVTGTEVFGELPDKNVLIVSNHQTYFADVTFFLFVIHAALLGRQNTLKYPGFLFSKKHNIYYIAAEETMKSGLMPKILALGGAITVQRSWRSNGENVRRKVSREGVANIDLAIKDGWVITFPQGTIKPFAQGRIGTAMLIKKHQPVVVPVVIDGFRRSFDKKGFRTKKTKSNLKMTVKQPLDINYDGTVEEIMSQVMDAIEQSPKHDFMKQLKEKEKTE